MDVNRIWVGLLLFLLVGLNAKAQDRYAIYFKFKPQSEFSFSAPQKFLTQNAIDRRSREQVQLDSLDLPVSKKYILEISALCAEILYSSKWMNVAVVVAHEADVDRVSTLPFVEKIELVAPGFLESLKARVVESEQPEKNDKPFGKSPEFSTGELALSSHGYDFQNELIGIDKMHEEGYTGKGVTIAVFDAGFPGTDTASPLAHLLENNQIVGQRDFVRPWNKDVFTAHQHGTNVLSLIAANEPAKLVSGAYDSDFVLVITEEVETEFRIEEFNWVRAAEFADSLGVDIISSSLGYLDFDDPAMNYSHEDLDGQTTVITRGAGIASEKGILVVNSVGNYGAMGGSSLLAPADAEGIISVGSVTKNGEVSSFSSTGPTADGRFKPELAAFGDSPSYLRADGALGSSNGTSFSAPQITALAAGLWQARPEWTKTELMENIFRSASQSKSPDNLLGYGVPNFLAALYGEVLGVGDDESVEWKVYPNPLTSEDLNINFGVELEGTLELIDLAGRTVFKKELSRSSVRSPYRIQLTGIQAGLYVLMMQDATTYRRTKLIKR
jgi:hypothetical protein